jgi:phage tail-like protein
MKPLLCNHFRIIFIGLDTSGQDDSGFQSISGLETTYAGGSRKVDTTGILPESMTVQPTLVLTRAVKHYAESPLTRWLYAHFNEGGNSPIPEAVVELLEEKFKPVMSWTVRTILPKSWKLGELHAEKAGVVLETIELTYKELLFRK